MILFSISAIFNSFNIFLATTSPIIRVIRPSPSGRIVIGDSLVPEMLKRFKDIVNEVSRKERKRVEERRGYKWRGDERRGEDISGEEGRGE